MSGRRPGGRIAAVLAALAGALLLALSPSLAAGAEQTPVDVTAQILTAQGTVSPGAFFETDPQLYFTGGRPENTSLRMALPPGLSLWRGYALDPHGGACTASADGRTVTCANGGAVNYWRVYLTVGADVPVGTVLPITVSPVADHSGDPTPGDDTATASVTVVPHPDWSVKWFGPSGPVQPGRPVSAQLMLVDNAAFDVETAVVSRLPADGAVIPAGTKTVGATPAGCDDSGGRTVCRPLWPVLHAFSFTYRWTFPASARGKELRLPVSLGLPDTDPANDRDTLVIEVARAPGPAARPASATPGAHDATARHADAHAQHADARRSGARHADAQPADVRPADARQTDARQTGAPGSDTRQAAFVTQAGPRASLIASAATVQNSGGLDLRAHVEQAAGSAAAPGFTLRLPKGTGYFHPEPGTYEAAHCAHTSDNLTVTCHGMPGDRVLDVRPRVVVAPNDRSLAAGTKLTFTLTADGGGPDATATATATVVSGPDWAVSWDAPATVAPHEVLRTSVIVVNNGPGTGRVNAAYLGFPDDGLAQDPDRLSLPAGSDCDADPGELECYIEADVPAGRSVTFTFFWRFSDASLGKVFTDTAVIESDRDAADNKAVLAVRIAGATGPTTPPTTPPGGGGPTTAPAPGDHPSPQGDSGAPAPGGTSGGTSGTSGGDLAATGAGGTGPLLAAACGALLLGAAAVTAARSRRGRGVPAAGSAGAFESSHHGRNGTKGNR